MILRAGVIAEDKLPLLEELWLYLYNTYFTDNNVYENINVNSGIVSIRNIIIGLAIGLALSGFFSVFNKRVLGRFVRALLKNECLSQESAKTLGELSFADKMLVRASLRRGYTLKRVVRCVEEEDFLKEEEKRREEEEAKRAIDPSLPKFKERTFVPSLDTDRFYIPEELKYMADIKFDSKGTTLRAAIASTVITVALVIALILVIPYILSLVDDLVGVFNQAAGKTI